MRTITAIIIALISCIIPKLYAQDIKQSNSIPSFSIGVTGGIASPSGNFTKTNYDDNNSGFAGTGYNAGITGTWHLNKNWGISAMVSYSKYSFKGIQNIADGFHEAFDVDSASATTRNSNHSVSILIGPDYTIPVTNKFFIGIRLLGGIVNTTLAGWDVVLTDASITHPPLTQDAANVSAFGMQGGLRLQYQLNHNWGVALSGDYFYSDPDFKIVNVDRNANAGRELTDYHQPISGINANVSLVYTFLK